MGDINKYAESAMRLGGILPTKGTGQTGYAQGLRYQYLKNSSQMYAAKAGQLASNVFEARCQGFNPHDFYEYRDVLIRSAPATDSATGEIMPDDYQQIYILQPTGLDELKPGAYMEFAGNVWIVHKGQNVGSPFGSGIVRRCNSLIHVLDYYGNILEAPMNFPKMGTLSNASHATENSIVAKNYMQCVCQYNEISSQFSENFRIILGKTAYSLRGVNNFTREFTYEDNSIHLLTYTIERSELLEQDSTEHECADYNSFSWEINTVAKGSMKVGSRQKIKTESIRMGDKVQSSAEKPINYIYKSSNENVLTVDETGTVYAAGQGAATIEVALAQNPTVTRTISIEAVESGGAYVDFISSPLSELAEYDSAIVSAALFQNGEATDAPVVFSFSGADTSSYSAEVLDNQSCRINCYSAAISPLTVRAESDGYSAKMTIKLTA